MTTKARVLLVDDTVLFRRAIASLLGAQSDFEVVGEASNGQEGVALAAQLRPDIAIVDLDMPVMGGLECARIVRERLPGTKIVMLTVSDDDEAFHEAVRIGVHGYLLKDLNPEQLFEMMRAAMRDETPVSPALVTRLLADLRAAERTSDVRVPRVVHDHDAALSARELEIMQLVAQGLSNREIGSRLTITEGTVKNHVHNALAKLKLSNRIQAATYLVSQGLGAPRR